MRFRHACSRPQRAALFALCAASLASGCDAPGSTPSLGGQTGDPGVTDGTPVPGKPDYVSLEPSGVVPKPPGPSGPCQSPPYTLAVADGSATRLVELDDAHQRWFDRVTQRVIDLADQDAPRLRARLELGQPVYGARVAPSRVLLGIYRQEASFAVGAERAAELGDDRLVLVDFGDPDRPAVLAERATAGDIVLVTTVAHAGGVRVYVVSDELAYDCRRPIKRTKLHAFTLDDTALEPAGTLDLGDSVSAVAARGGQLLVLEDRTDPNDGAVSTDPSAYTLALDAPEALPAPSAKVPAPRPPEFPPQLWVERAGDVWTLVAQDLDTTQTRIVRFDGSDPAAPDMRADCSLQLDEYLTGLWTLGERVFVSHLTNAAQHVFASDITNASSSVFELDPKACTATERAQLGLARVPGADALLELDFGSTGTLEARLLGSASSEPIASASVALPAGSPEPDGVLGQVLREAVSWQAESGASEPHLLAVSLGPAGDMNGERAVQLFSFSATSITARAAVSPAYALTVRTEQGVAVRTGQGIATLTGGERGQLTGFTLDPSAPPRAHTPLELQPRFTRGYALDGQHWLRLRLQPDFERNVVREALTEDEILYPVDTARAALEVLPVGGDPELAPAIGQVDVNPWAQLVRVGSLFSSIANREHGAPGTTRIELFDFSDPAAPRARGVLESDALWVGDNAGELRGPWIECLECDPPGGDGPVGLATSRALVLRGNRWIEDMSEKAGGHSSFAFEIVDLSDPDQPKLGQTLRMAEEDLAYGAFAVGDSVYYRYARPIANDSTHVRFFVQRIGLEDPSEPELPEPFNVPGELVAARDEQTWYTVELIREGTELGATLHRLRVRDGAARIEASRELGARQPTAVTLDGDRILVDLGLPLDAPPWFVDGRPGQVAPPVRLLVLDAGSLEPLAEGDVAFGATRLGAAQGTAVYSLSNGTLLVDASAPGDPAKQRYLPGAEVVTDQRIAFANGHVLLTNGDNATLRAFALGLPAARP